MHIAYITKKYLSSQQPIPNKEIALHQINIIIKHDLPNLILAQDCEKINKLFSVFQTNLKGALNYFDAK